MTAKEEVIFNIMSLHVGTGVKDSPLSHLTPSDIWKWIDKVNALLKDAPFYYLLTADCGVVVKKKPTKGYFEWIDDRKESESSENNKGQYKGQS